MEDVTSIQDRMANLVYATEQRVRSLHERKDAGEEVSDGELIDALTEHVKILRDAVVWLGLEIDKDRHRDASCRSK